MKTKDITWRNPMMPMMYALNLLGRMPFSVTKSGEPRVSLVSVPVGWALALTLFHGSIAMRQIYLYTSHTSNWENFNRVINTINTILLHISTYHTVGATWRATPHVIQAMNRWAKFYDLFLYTTYQPISSTMLDNSHIGVIIIFLGSSFISLQVNHTYHDYVRVYKIVPGVLVVLEIFYAGILVFLWSIFCLLVQNTAAILKNNVLELNSGPTASETLHTYRLVWLELQACTVATSRALGKTMNLWVFHVVALNLLSQFGVLMYALVDHSLDAETMLFTLIISTFNILLIFSMSHWAQKCMTADLLKALYSRRWLRLSEHARTELDLFLDAVQMSKPCFEISGLFTPDKGTIISLQTMFQIINVLCTYLVVLMQLKVSAEEVK